MRIILPLAVACSLTGCGLIPEAPPPQIVVVTKEAPTFVAPSECNDHKDKKWIDPPDADVTLKESTRIWQTNKQGRIDVGVKRHVCFAAIAAYDKAQPKDKPNGSK